MESLPELVGLVDWCCSRQLNWFCLNRLSFTVVPPLRLCWGQMNLCHLTVQFDCQAIHMHFVRKDEGPVPFCFDSECTISRVEQWKCINMGLGWFPSGWPANMAEVVCAKEGALLREGGSAVDCYLEIMWVSQNIQNKCVFFSPKQVRCVHTTHSPWLGSSVKAQSSKVILLVQLVGERDSSNVLAADCMICHTWVHECQPLRLGVTRHVVDSRDDLNAKGRGFKQKDSSPR